MSDAMTDRRGQDNEKKAPVQLKAKIIDVWEALRENDQNEGRGGTTPIGYYMDEEQAQHAVIHTGVMGTPGPYDWAKVISIDGGKTGWAIDYDNPVTIIPAGDAGMKIQMSQNRKGILEKLSENERELLGYPANLDDFKG